MQRPHRGRGRPDPATAAPSTSSFSLSTARPASRTARPTTPRQRRRDARSASDSTSVDEALQCARVGERFALADPGRRRLSAAGSTPDRARADDDASSSSSTSIAAYLGKADGINQLPQDGMPTVVTAPDGRPGITVPSTEAPEELEVATIKAGGHETVEDGDSVVVHFSSFTWPAPGDVVNEVDSSWPRTPITVVVDENATASAAQGVPPVAAAQLVGTKVGSQVLVVIPPDDVSGRDPHRRHRRSRHPEVGGHERSSSRGVGPRRGPALQPRARAARDRDRADQERDPVDGARLLASATARAATTPTSSGSSSATRTTSAISACRSRPSSPSASPATTRTCATASRAAPTSCPSDIAFSPEETTLLNLAAMVWREGSLSGESRRALLEAPCARRDRRRAGARLRAARARARCRVRAAQRGARAARRSCASRTSSRGRGPPANAR